MIKTPVADEIRQLVISPNSDYLAVLTAHTIHICVLPDPSHLTSSDNEPLKPKFYTLGPTTHVTSRSAIMSALWHPLGVNGTSLVTVTEDAVVRIWELSTTDRWSFDAPTLAIDLKKLADGTSLDQDFTASSSATNTTFSPDSFDMEVAAASFAVKGSGLWSSMTLFTAMRGGDVYALCPLLPQRWAPPPALIPSLSVSIVDKLAATEDDPDVSPQDKLLAQQQVQWMSDLDNQEPRVVPGSLGEPPVEVYQRPTRPGLIPKLQGPLNLEAALSPDDEDDLDTELADIYVIGRKMETDDLMMGEDEDLELDENEQRGLSLSVVCLLSTSGQLRICLDLDGIEAKWLPPRVKSKISAFAGVDDPPSLLTFQTLDVLQPLEVSPDRWPVFSDDPISRYTFFVTHDSGISQISLQPWVFRLERELNAEAEDGSDLRVDLVANSGSERKRVFQVDPPGASLAACVAISDPDLGYFILSSTHSEPVALTFETPADDPLGLRPRSPSPYYERSPEVKPMLEMYTPRPHFQPSGVFDQPSQLPDLLQMLKTSRFGALAHQEVRLSPVTLKIFSDAHVHLSAETGRLNTAVSELFRRCDSLRADLKEQITKANDLKSRIDGITGEDVGGRKINTDEARIIRNIHARREKQQELVERFDKLRKKLNKISSRELTDKERQWVEEVKRLKGGVLGPEADNGDSAAASKMKSPLKRFNEVKNLKDELLEQAKEVQNKADDDAASDTVSISRLKIPTEIRKAKVSQVMSMLERETALVDAVKGRLEHMSIG